jgi:hypothetical protein
MFGNRKKTPSKVFIHQPDCRIAEIDPGVEIPWNYLGDGLWRADCACGFETFTEPLVDNRTRQDPLDPKTSRHLGQCEHRDTIDPVLIKALLTVRPGANEGYWWVTCNSCGTSWPVAYYAESAQSVG